MEQNKIKTYINFAKRSRTLIFGVDDIIKSKKVEIVLYSDLLAESSKKKLINFSKSNNVFEKEIENKIMNELLQNESVKAVGVTDKNLANAIRMNFTNDVSNGGNLE